MLNQLHGPPRLRLIRAAQNQQVVKLYIALQVRQGVSRLRFITAADFQ